LCNRITMTLPDAATLLLLLGLPQDLDASASYRPRYNVAPTQLFPVVTPPVPLRLQDVKWGMGARRQLNTRVEGVLKRGLGNGVVPCAVPVTGFLEWEGPKDARVPVLFEPRGEDVMLLAGLCDGTGFTVLTTRPDDVVKEVHDRMPVLLTRQGYQHWLQAAVPNALPALLEAGGGVTLQARRVSRRVNSVAHDDAACLLPESEIPDVKPRQLTLL
jgi:putative SOS response-associated peptidase YedK